MTKPARRLLLAACIAIPAIAAAQDFSPNCIAEMRTRGFGDFQVENVRSTPSLVRGIMRRPGEVREFQCDMNGDGTVYELRVNFVGQANSPSQPRTDSREFKRGYSDGYRRAPYNNYRNDDDYERGYDAGNSDRRRR